MAISSTADTGDPIQRFLARESSFLQSMLDQLHTDLQLLQKILNGNQRHTNLSRQITDALAKGLVPKSWLRYSCRIDTGLEEWTNNLKLRIQHVNLVCTEGPSQAIWLGGLTFPAGLLTAFRQKAAHDQGVSIESLNLDMQFGRKENAFLIKGILFL